MQFCFWLVLFANPVVSKLQCCWAYLQSGFPVSQAWRNKGPKERMFLMNILLLWYRDKKRLVERMMQSMPCCAGFSKMRMHTVLKWVVTLKKWPIPNGCSYPNWSKNTNPMCIMRLQLKYFMEYCIENAFYASKYQRCNNCNAQMVFKILATTNSSWKEEVRQPH